MSLDILRTVPLFDSLGDEELALLAERCSVEGYPEGEVLFRQGDTVDGLYLVETGSVSIYRDEVGQPVQRLARIGPGGFFGEMGVLDNGGVRSASARAAEPTRLIKLERDGLLGLLRERPLLAIKLRTAIIRRHGDNVASAVELSGRREIRTRVDMPVELELEDGATHQARLENLSTGGACLRHLPAAWKPGRRLAFRLRLPDGQVVLEVAGTLAWRSGASSGVAFRHEDSESETRVRRALRRVLEARRDDQPDPDDGRGRSRRD